ncbi:MAG: hypothetical protein HC806_06630 [Anaerolineae bacterium]|nr:hypothetical protein [Anaerolineae bacterium]
MDDDEDRLRAIEAGADDFVTKPFKSIVLLTRVRSLLRIKFLYDELETRNVLLRKILNRYVDEEVANIILTDPERYLKLGGETRYIYGFVCRPSRFYNIYGAQQPHCSGRDSE